jgi:hypothetical protein
LVGHYFFLPGQGSSVSEGFHSWLGCLSYYSIFFGMNRFYKVWQAVCFRSAGAGEGNWLCWTLGGVFCSVKLGREGKTGLHFGV